MKARYMFSGYRGKWIPDTPQQRRTVVERLRTWNVFSNSSPIEGIVEAIRTYHAKDKKISLYVFGDEFTGSSIDSVVKGVDIINREDATGERRVRIHAIGFPVRPDAPQYTSIRFATLMRILCQRNGGSFVGLDDPQRGGPKRSHWRHHRTAARHARCLAERCPSEVIVNRPFNLSNPGCTCIGASCSALLQAA